MAKQLHQNYTPEGILSLLQKHGSIWVNCHDSVTKNLIITGIFGDGTPEATNLQIIDPNGGYSYQETFLCFLEKLAIK